jgi:ABC-type dipeptide/oligopeptide/nickel transport system permease component
VNPEDVGKSVLVAVTVVLILSYLWPYIPSSGPFSQIPKTMEAVSGFVIPAIVVGAPAVAYYLLNK